MKGMPYPAALQDACRRIDMPLIDKQLQEVWDALRADNSRRDHALQSIRIRNLRGIQDLRVPFTYPVSVLAGPNGCGKSTVLFACACAYRDPKRKPKDLTPSSLFPNFDNRRQQELSDSIERTELAFDYIHEGTNYPMDWNRGKSWNRSFRGRKGGKQPERTVYLRTLANLTNPSEVRGLLQLARKEFETETLTPDLLIFAHRILRRRYRNLSVIASGDRDLLFAETEDEQTTRYSEFHMSSGERAILRISRDISRLENALILIDEIEAGLHPYTQQQTMLELQRIALRQKLQIIVASHSPVVLDSVPADGRLFLDRYERTAEVRLMPVWRDIFQKALYGQSRDQLSILCEDDIAESVIRGVLDMLNPVMDLRPDDVLVGRNTGRDEFPAHVHTLGKFGKLRDFLMVMDGDARDGKHKIEQAAERYGHHARLVFLPGDASPEHWVWNRLREHPQEYAAALGITQPGLERNMQEIEQLVEGGVQQTSFIKSALNALGDNLNRPPQDIARLAGRTEAEKKRGDMARFLVEFEERIAAWRQP